MRLLIIAPHYNYFIKGQIEALSDYLDEVYVFVKYNPLVELFSRIPISYGDYLKNYTKNRILNLKGLPENVNVYVVSTVYFIPDGKNKRLGNMIVKKTLNLIESDKIKFDIIHSHFTWPYGYAGVKLSRWFDVPVVVTVHEDYRWLTQEIESKDKNVYWTWKRASALIRVSAQDLALLKRFNDNVSYIPNGFDPLQLPTINRTLARKYLNLAKDIKVIFSLGNLVQQKGYIYLIQAMSEIVKHRKDVLCFIGGSGPLKGKLQKQINNLGLQDHVKLLGFVPDDKLALWMNAADLFVLPSLSEGNPTVMFEALGVGLPFVGTTVGGVPEIITSEDYGLLCPPKDPECLAEKILMALEKEWDREKIEKYAEQFTWEEIAKRIFKIYQELLSGG